MIELVECRIEPVGCRIGLVECMIEWCSFVGRSGQLAAHSLAASSSVAPVGCSLECSLELVGCKLGLVGNSLVAGKFALVAGRFALEPHMSSVGRS